MAANEKLEDYFAIELSLIRKDQSIPFSIYLHLPLNQHMVRIFANNELAPAKKIESYQAKKVNKVYLHQRDKAAFDAYLMQSMPRAVPPVEQIPTVTDEEQYIAEQPTNETPSPTQSSGEFVAEVLQSPKVTAPQKEAIVKEVAKDMLEDLATAQTIAEQKIADKKAREMINQIVGSLNSKPRGLLDEFMQLAKLDPELEHAVNVASYAVIFAMAFGKIEPALLADLAMSGLLHDIGISQIPSDITRLPLRKMQASQIAIYSDHVTQSASLIRRYAPDAPERVMELLSQHHEKFDGTGFPRHLEGFDFDDIAQLLGLAEILDAMMNGSWDGEKRTFSMALSKLDSLEKARSFPEYFDPDIFHQVTEHVQSDQLSNSMDNAAKVVKTQVQKLVKNESESKK